MSEVRGRTLATVLEAVHTASAAGWATETGGVSFRRLVDHFFRVCECVGYAHVRWRWTEITGERVYLHLGHVLPAWRGRGVGSRALRLLSEWTFATTPTVRIGTAVVPLPPGSFLQATRAGEETLAGLVTEHVGKAKQVADLFCGVGPFALRLAENAKVTAMDSDEAALEALSRASAAPGLKPITVQKRDLFRRPLTSPEMKSFDAVVFDPPRQGAEAQARELAKSKVPLVIAVSCNAATFARDAKILIDGGYQLSAVTPVDQFKYTAHVEIVAAFAR
jgi:SAM-dependent methyltransferase